MADPNKDVDEPADDDAPLQSASQDNNQENGNTDNDMAKANNDAAQQSDEPWIDDGEELSLDDLGAAYARAAAKHDPEAFAPNEEDDEAANESDAGELEAAFEDEADAEVDELVTPEAIIEGALFIGHPENKLITEQRLAALMREVTPEEVVELIAKLNQSYRDADQALRIIRDDQGYRMTISPEVENVRRSFSGKIREA
ncbi:SMC-Scp complex subunit ScpB, partial [Novipirellula sp.]|uniref:SMC-Scp complex subunit ScpB n=1 Tax=Novipirellula sp. TaxID=2795430 RepID=UPI003569357D